MDLNKQRRKQTHPAENKKCGGRCFDDATRRVVESRRWGARRTCLYLAGDGERYLRPSSVYFTQGDVSWHQSSLFVSVRELCQRVQLRVPSPRARPSRRGWRSQTPRSCPTITPRPQAELCIRPLREERKSCTKGHS